VPDAVLDLAQHLRRHGLVEVGGEGHVCGILRGNRRSCSDVKYAPQPGAGEGFYDAL
jgi:hypothetical protein